MVDVALGCSRQQAISRPMMPTAYVVTVSAMIRSVAADSFPFTATGSGQFNTAVNFRVYFQVLIVRRKYVQYVV